ncbi:hypothetical protein Mapa_016683 [Marchantia paleacea]|nr:hypothetical protein Mapa_016683 [Marchantia paleacea]
MAGHLAALNQRPRMWNFAPRIPVRNELKGDRLRNSTKYHEPQRIILTIRRKLRMQPIQSDEFFVKLEARKLDEIPEQELEPQHLHGSHPRASASGHWHGMDRGEAQTDRTISPYINGPHVLAPHGRLIPYVECAVSNCIRRLLHLSESCVRKFGKPSSKSTSNCTCAPKPLYYTSVL